MGGFVVWGVLFVGGGDYDKRSLSVAAKRGWVIIWGWGDGLVVWGWFGTGMAIPLLYFWLG